VCIAVSDEALTAMPRAKATSKTPKNLRNVLDNLPWPEGLDTQKLYARFRDDHDGTFQGRLLVQIGPDGDAYIGTDGRPGEMIRFRTLLGGGNSTRVRNALVLLALAIKLDSDERPDPSPRRSEEGPEY
jgi:hypothetical protein